MFFENSAEFVIFSQIVNKKLFFYEILNVTEIFGKSKKKILEILFFQQPQKPTDRSIAFSTKKNCIQTFYFSDVQYRSCLTNTILTQNLNELKSRWVIAFGLEFDKIIIVIAHTTGNRHIKTCLENVFFLLFL